MAEWVHSPPDQTTKQNATISFNAWFRLSKGLQNYKGPLLKKKAKNLFVFKKKKKKLFVSYFPPRGIKTEQIIFHLD